MASREELVHENLGLVKYIVKRFQDRGREYDDLFQYGCMGLLKAIERFDPAFNVAFSTYAVPVIMGEVRRFLRDDSSVHVARSIKDNAKRIEAARERILKETGREPSIEAIAESLQMSRGDVLLALNAVQPVRSLDAPIDSENTLSLGETIGYDEVEEVDKKILLQSLLKVLPKEDMRLIALRYFQAKTQTEIAKEMGISQVQVSRLESKILKRLRGYAEGEEYPNSVCNLKT